MIMIINNDHDDHYDNKTEDHDNNADYEEWRHDVCDTYTENSSAAVHYGSGVRC